MGKIKDKKLKKSGKGGSMSLSEHLKELRNRVVICLLVFIVAAVVSFAYAGSIISILTDMGKSSGYSFIYLRPQELLMVHFNASLICGLVVAIPVIAYEVFAFCSPGLKKKEKSFVLFGMIFGSIFFAVGVFFAYKVMLPFMLKFLITFGDGGVITASISIEQYISFLLTIFLIFGVIFELPVLSVILTILGIIKPQWLVKARKAMIVIIFILAAIITPPDIVSQIMVAIPIIFLYELSIILSKIIYKFKKKKADEEENEDDDEEDEDEDEDEDE